MQCSLNAVQVELNRIVENVREPGGRVGLTFRKPRYHALVYTLKLFETEIVF